MGTRALTHIYDTPSKKLEDGSYQQGDLICTVYRQFDGYPENHGAELRDIIRGHRIVNGICPEDFDADKQSNGMGEFAIKMVSVLKNGHPIGNIYMSPVEGWHDKDFIDFEYHVEPTKDPMEFGTLTGPPFDCGVRLYCTDRFGQFVKMPKKEKT